MAETVLNHCSLGNFHAFLSSAGFFKIIFFEKILSGIPSKCQTEMIQTRPDLSLDLIWVQSVCKGYQQTTLVDRELKGYLSVTFHTNCIAKHCLINMVYLTECAFIRS